MTKPILLILSDINGNDENDWLKLYQEELDSHFKILYFDSRLLAGIDLADKSQDEIHAEFVDGGIDVAVEKLLTERVNQVFVLAFSIGGTIAWKAALNGMSVVKIVAVSSTRLRKEYQKPKCMIELFFGEKDMNRPMDEWFEPMEMFPNILYGKEHDMYKEESVAEKVVQELMSNS